MPQLKDHLPHVNAAQVVKACFAYLHGISDFPPDMQVMASAVLVRVIAERAGLDLGQLLDAARRVEQDADTFFQRETKALRDYVDGEIKDFDPKSINPVSIDLAVQAIERKQLEMSSK
jgi:hypothetical protein